MRRLTLTVTPEQAGRTVRSLLRRELRMADGAIARVKTVPDGICLNGAHARTVDCVQAGDTLTVRIDDKQGSELAARHLITLGHRDIAYIRTDREVTLHFSVQGRFDSFMTCCKSNGVEPRVFVTDEGKNNISKVVTQLLSSDHMPTAIACQEDGIAIPLLFQLERNGFTIPNDISIIGYDDSTYARDLGLTTIRQTPVEMAHEAARMTLALIDKQPLDEPFKTFPAQLIVRSTTARLRH